MPRKKINIGKPSWNSNRIDMNQLQALVARIRKVAKRTSEDRRFISETASRLEYLASVGSILMDLDYGDMFDRVEGLKDDDDYTTLMGLMEELYTVLDIGGLATDNAKRWEVEKKILIEKGLTSA